MLLVAVGAVRSLRLSADGTCSSHTFLTETLACIPEKSMILERDHLHQKCLELGSRTCCAKQGSARPLLLGVVHVAWRWCGGSWLDRCLASQARNEAALTTRIA